ncbi:hypothetical protein FS837_003160 [Tulasnella sp. UAMH 9824]|nr:hypothetical protein FS837_003160 [Tulasnella sp. UAMH 9824]
MTRLGPLLDDTPGPLAYNGDVQPQPGPTYASVASQTEPTICLCGHLSLTVDLGEDREPVACSSSALSKLSSTSHETPFINLDLEPVASHPFMLQLSSPPPISPYPDPAPPASNDHLGEDHAMSTSSDLASPVILSIPAHNPMPPSSPTSSDLSSSSLDSSEGSYGSWSSSVAAEANDLMAGYEAREFGSSANQQAAEESQSGASEGVYWLDNGMYWFDNGVYNDVEMHDANTDTN